jgi:hypothetical protein
VDCRGCVRLDWDGGSECCSRVVFGPSGGCAGKQGRRGYHAFAILVVGVKERYCICTSDGEG